MSKFSTMDSITRFLENENQLTYKERSIIDLAQQVLNRKINFFQEEDNIKELFRVYANAYKENYSLEYYNSMEKSRDTYKKSDSLPLALKKLKDDEASSFLIVPIEAKGHMFAAVVRKINNEYSVVVVNKGSRGDNHKFEEYIMSYQKMISTFEKLTDNPKIESIYDYFKANSRKKFILPIAAKNQKVGNCFIKEPENAIKFATTTANYSTSDFENLRQVKIKMKLGWPTGAKSAHSKFINQLIKDYPNLKEILNSELKIYLANKAFRNYLNLNMDPKEAVILAYSSLEDTKGLDTNTKVKELLKYVTLDTIIQSNKEFNKFSKKLFNNKEAKKLSSDLKYYFKISNGLLHSLVFYEGMLNFTKLFGRKKTFKGKLVENLNIGEKYLPLATMQLRYDFHAVYLMLGASFGVSNFNKKALLNLNAAEMLYKNNGDLKLYKGLLFLNAGKLKIGVDYLKEAITLKKDYLLANELFNEFKNITETEFKNYKHRNLLFELFYKKGAISEKAFEKYQENVISKNLFSNIDRKYNPKSINKNSIKFDNQLARPSKMLL
jgi:hypothetical protein